tara:strand:- start:7374 stop:7601 length:228 start_codon:yes stop_codon:yes gene_type:complete
MRKIADPICEEALREAYFARKAVDETYLDVRHRLEAAISDFERKELRAQEKKLLELVRLARDLTIALNFGDEAAA